MGPFGRVSTETASLVKSKQVKACEAKISGFIQLLISMGLQNSFMLQYLDLLETGETEAKISPK